MRINLRRIVICILGEVVGRVANRPLELDKMFFSEDVFCSNLSLKFEQFV